MGQWSDEERHIAQGAIDEYKRLRPFLGGHRFLLTGPLHQDWEVWQFVHPEREDFAILAFREDGEITDIRVRLRIPFKNRSYQIQGAGTGDAVTIPGAELEARGIALSLPEQHSSKIVWVTTVS
jgi:hypothetical protein